MRIVERLPVPIRVVENVFIPLSDGSRVAAKLWIPEDAESRPVPVVMEYIPYRKRDFTARRDAQAHAYLAGHGYASIRVDCRGAGDSDGLMHDEYLAQELEDGAEVIGWLAAQPWSTGKVGMFGGSWGGFNSLQVAALRPAALKAIITVVSTDDRYADDMHYMGGAVLNDMLSWGQQFFAQRGRPPDPAIVGERWREMWTRRLDAIHPQLVDWMTHQRRDAFWKHGSICEDYSAIECAVYAIGGWVDGYSNAVFRMMKGLTCPKKALVGPWGHGRPHFAYPGPMVGYLQEQLRWWDHWLKGRDTGIMREPAFKAWMQDSVEPKSFYEFRQGRWITEPSWPTPNLRDRRYVLSSGTLSEGDEAAAGPVLSIRSPETVGIAGGEWCPFGLGGVGPELPLDQRMDDGGSLVFDSAPLAERLEILGAPIAELALSADKPRANLIVRLSDIRPDGSVLRVTYGVLNLTHRDSHETPAPLEPGRIYRVRLALNEIAHVFPAGHRLRIAISTAYWPILFPSPDRAMLSIVCGTSSVTLPQRPPRAEDAAVPDLPPPEGAPLLPAETARAASVVRTLKHDVGSGRVEYRIDRDDGRLKLLHSGTFVETVKSNVYRIKDDDPLAAESTVTVTYKLERPGWNIEIRTAVTLTGDAMRFRLVTDFDAFEGDVRVCSRSWDDRIARDLV
ncbi:MAG: CocE/NonD family hydrolase [Alphaproteobacteria bacterium]|nr:CocE/NonD family hydrolase [Alphaproteobacteria bacterium]